MSDQLKVREESNKMLYLRFDGQCGPNAPEGEVQMFCRGSEPARAGDESMGDEDVRQTMRPLNQHSRSPTHLQGFPIQ